MRQRNKAWADEFLKENTDLILHHPSQYKGKWHTEVFKNTRPIHVEIGTGKGQFLVNMAEKHPEVNFIGIELAKSVVVTAAQKVLASEQENIYLIQENAHHLPDIFSQGEVDAIFLNFSDPWPKKRHEKRRLTSGTFLNKYSDILKKEGKLMMKTDNPAFFEYSLVRFSQLGMILDEVNMNLNDDSCPDRVMTEYEERFTNQGKAIYYCSVHL